MPNPIHLALDTPDLPRALDMARRVAPHVGGFKVGLELFTAAGPDGVRAVAELGRPIFLDLKLHDIPNTVAASVRALAPLKPTLLTVHAGGGTAMMRAAAEAAGPGTQVVGVTVLTSLDDDDLGELGVDAGAGAQVGRLTRLAREAGLGGVVCSGREVGSLKAGWPDGAFVVPGVRPQGAEAGDQKRAVTPARALADGATVLVIGRPITGAEDPAAAARTVAESLRRA